MPYIEQAQRHHIDPHIEGLKATVRDMLVRDDQVDGIVNYVVTRVVSSLLLEGRGVLHYADIARAVTALECAKMELYRKVAAPYEDVKAAENGDVYP
jgi:hypothetical protein